MKKTLLLSSIVFLNLYGAGYKVPEQSTDSVAMSASNIAKSYGADASYFNPANMNDLENKFYFELGVNRYSLSKVKFENSKTNVESKPTTLFAPNLFFVTPKYNNFRFGFYLVNPAGLKIRWDDIYPASTAKEFELKVTEISPSISFALSDSTTIGASVRYIRTEGTVENDFVLMEKPIELKDHKYLKGNANSFGYSLGVNQKINDNVNLALVFRSKANLHIKGDANLKLIANNSFEYNGKADISVPLPASLTLGTSYSSDNFDILFAIERTFWSSFKKLDFNFPVKLNNPIFEKIDDAPVYKHYRDSNAYRIGYVYKGFKDLRLMAGFTYDERAQKADTIGFDLPDTKAFIYSAGLNYDINKDFSVGASILYQHRFARNVSNMHISKDPKMPLPPYLNVVGKFKASNGLITGLSIKYKF